MVCLLGKLSGKGDVITRPELEQLKQDVITVMNRIRIDAENGEFDENSIEYQTVFEEMRVENAQPRTTCEPGYIKQEDYCGMCLAF